MKFGMNPSPYFRSKRSTTQIMLELLIGLSVIWICAIVYYFTLSSANGVRAIVNPLIAMLTAVVTESLFMLPKHIKEKGSFVGLLKKLLNSYGYITGMILALLLPVATSVYAIVISTIFSIAVGKMLFGGFGHNIFNPAILGRIFAQTAFLSKMAYDTEIATGATVTTMLGHNGWSLEMMKYTDISLGDLLLGSYRGALGETFTAVLLVVGVVLVLRKVIDWRAPVFYVGTIFVSGVLMGLIGGYGVDSFEFALVQIASGGVMFGAVFCLTDPVTSPTSPSGRITFVLGSALITMLIRYFGAAPEGVAYSILIMNALTPLIDSTVRGLSNQFTRKKVITTCVMGALAITSGCVAGASKVEKAAFVNYKNSTLMNKTGDLTSTVQKVSEKGGIAKYQVAVSGYIGANTAFELGNINELFSNELAAYQKYFTDAENYKKASFKIKKSGSSRILQVSYVDIKDNGTRKTEDVKVDDKSFDLKPIQSESGKWVVGTFVTEYSTETYPATYDVTLKNDVLILTFADDHNSSLENNASYASVSFYVSMNFKKREIVSTELISCGGGGGYGDVLVSDKGGSASNYFEYMNNKEKAVAFYNNYIKIDNPVSFDAFTKELYTSYLDVTALTDPEGGAPIHVGATYTALGYVTLMQRVIEYAEAEHTSGKVA